MIKIMRSKVRKMDIVENCTECESSKCLVLGRYCTMLDEKDSNKNWVNTDCPPKGRRWDCPLQTKAVS